MKPRKQKTVWVLCDEENRTYLYAHNPLTGNAAAIRSIDITDALWLVKGLNLRRGQCREIEIREISNLDKVCKEAKEVR